jgi:hypothetical protein
MIRWRKTSAWPETPDSGQRPRRDRDGANGVWVSDYVATKEQKVQAHGRIVTNRQAATRLISDFGLKATEPDRCRPAIETARRALARGMAADRSDPRVPVFARTCRSAHGFRQGFHEYWAAGEASRVILKWTASRPLRNIHCCCGSQSRRFVARLGE